MESTELQLYSLPESSTDLEAAFVSEGYTDRLIEEVRSKAKSVVGDLNTVKGRKAYISMAATVRSSKVAIDDAGKALVAEMKRRPALVDASRRKIREALDELAIEIRQPVTNWEAEQERIKAEEKFNADHAEALEMNAAFDKALAERIESDHEIALLMNDKFDRDRAEAARIAEQQRIEYEQRIAREAEDRVKQEEEAKRAAEALAKQIESDHEIALLMNDKVDRDRVEAARIAEQQRIEHEQRIAREAEERVKREAEEKAKREREESARREAALEAKAEQERLDRIAAQERADQDAKDAKEKAEREKQEAIEAERRKAQNAEQRRLAEEQRIKDELAQRTADENHRKRIGTEAVTALINVVGLTREQAINTFKAIKDGSVPHTNINY